jgi:predicted DCC family thiol-disulfide oxidoreductase YuxK
MQSIKNYKYSQYFVFKIIFALYLFIHFFQLMPVGTELFSSQGLIPEANWNLSFPFFPNLLYFYDSPLSIQIFLGILAISSLGLIFQRSTTTCAIICWYGFACLFNRNNFISNPSLFYVGWILLALIVIPAKRSKFNFPKLIFNGGWFIMGLSYTISGLHKAMAPSWQDGNAIKFLIDNPLARNHSFNEFLLSLPDFTLQILTWSVLFIEIFALIGIMFNRTRFITWLALVLLHLGILASVNFSDLTIGMILFHLFLFDPNWIKRKTSKDLTVFYDGDCGVCNSFIQFLLKNSRHIKFSALQSDFALRNLSQEYIRDLNTIVIIKNGEILDKSDAIIEIYKELDGIYPIVSCCKIIPKMVRDHFYQLFSNNRLKLGTKSTCSLLSKEEKMRFI